MSRASIVTISCKLITLNEERKRILYFCAPNRGPMPSEREAKRKYLFKYYVFYVETTVRIAFEYRCLTILFFMEHLRVSRGNGKRDNVGRRQNKSKRGNLFSEPFFPSKYYRATYTWSHISESYVSHASYQCF